MRKRRRLADKLTIMVCAVLVAVSAFFYAPMEVSAEENIVLNSDINLDLLVNDLPDVEINTDFNTGMFPFYVALNNYTVGSVDFSDYFTLQDNVLYSVDVFTNLNVTSSRAIYAWPCATFMHFDDSSFYLLESEVLNYETTLNYGSNSRKIFFYGNDSIADVVCSSVFYSSSAGNVDVDISVSFNFSNFSQVDSASSDDYQNGYNAGYTAGEQAGFGNGYSQGFADGEASVDTNEIYNQGFNAGKDSVDTQSYYDAGYQAGYQVAYQEGYDSGYDEGYQSAMDRIDGWGADTTDYPSLLLDKPLMSRVFDVVVKSSIPTRYSDFGEWTTDLIFNPNHTYRFNVVLNPTEYKEGSADIYFLNEDIFYLNVGGIKYRISNFSTAYVNTFFVPGDRMSSAYSFSWEPLLAVLGDTMDSGSAYCYYDLNYQIYDMGPSGDTQNHIANQTDSLTNGFNDSHGNSVNNEFSSGLNDFETAEDSLFSTATTGLKDFTFFDIQSVPAMVTGMSFVGSIMSGWFTQAGGASGVGIVLSILFSIMLVAMVLGLYRWYQSKGGKD